MNLREARERANMTQQEVANELGISRPTYIAMEKDPGRVSIVEAQHLSELLKVPMCSLFFTNSDS